MEENKVATRDKLAKVIGEASVHAEYKVLAASDWANVYADAILQSPDLRVTLDG